MGPETTATLRYASFWKRMNAYGYDLILMQMAALVPMLLFYSFPSLEDFVQLAPSVDAWGTAYTDWWIGVSAVYNILMVAGPKQATLGKAHCGIKVTDVEGGRLSLAQSAVRHGLSGLSMLLGGVPCLTILFTRERLAPHDMLASTRVIYRTTPPPVIPA